MNQRSSLVFAFTVLALAAVSACSNPVLTLDAATETGSDGVSPNDVIDASTCPTGQTRCGSACVDTATSNANCGACGTVCPGDQTCNAGHCELHCPSADMTACGSGPLARCVYLNTDMDNCGACGHACTGGTVCALGACLCPAGQSLCAGTCVDLQSDSANCSVCGRACMSPATCFGGYCASACVAPRTVCHSSQTLTDMCVDLTTHPLHCGACNSPCAPGASCIGGICSCPSGTVTCNGRCVNTSYDIGNCGTCGHACGAGQSCSSGVCACNAPQAQCGGVCTSTQYDPNNCGTCGNRCGPGASCNAGVCGCPVGTVMCGGACSTTMADPQNCGGCGIACGTNQACVSSACQPVPSGHYTYGVATATYHDVCSMPGALQILREIDDFVTPPIPVPFTFRFYGDPYNSVRVSSNGYVIVGGGGSMTDWNYATRQPLPDPSRPAPAIFAYSADLFQRGTAGKGICIATEGSAPNRHFVIQSSDASFCCGDSDSAHLNYEIVINEADNTIDLLYGYLNPGSHSNPVAVGVQDAAAARATTFDYGTAPLSMITSSAHIHLTFVP